MAYDLSKVVVTSSPHIKADDDTRSLMLDVLIALVPALAVSLYTFCASSAVFLGLVIAVSPAFWMIFQKNTPKPTDERVLSRPGKCGLF